MPAPPAAAAAAASSDRKPSIHFRHGRREGVEERAAGRHQHAGAAASAGTPADVSSAGDSIAYVASAFPSKATLEYSELPLRYARPAYTEAELFAIGSGGCEYVPPPKEKKGGKK